MKQFYLCALTVSLALSAQAVVPFEKGKTAPRQHRFYSAATLLPSRATETKTLLLENFEKFSQGSESELSDYIEYENTYDVPSSYTQIPGWKGHGLRQAGGSVALTPWTNSYGEQAEGYIQTPKFMLDGTATLTFRAKTLTAGGATLWVVVCDDYDGPGDDRMDAQITSEWKEYTMTATNASLSELSYYQFSAEEMSTILLDDVKVDFKQDRIGTPNALYAQNSSPTEFVARWNEVYGAEGYLLNVLCTKAPTDVVTGELVENFDGIKVNSDGKTIDKSAPNYPKGWTISVSDNGTQDVTADPSNLNSAPTALMFDAVGDMIESPETPEPIDKIQIWGKSTAYSDSFDMMSLVKLEIYHSTNDRWENIAHLAYYNFPEGGGFYTVGSDVLGNDVTKVRVSYIQRGDIDYYIDDIKLHYATKGVTSPMLEDFKVAGTEYAVKDIDPRNEYYYYVKAYRGDIVSSSSYTIWVDGIAGLKVETEDATNISSSAFTANWKPLGHATEYTVNLSSILQPKADMKDVVVIEESFDNINEGTVDSPGTDWVSPFDFGTKGWANTSWGATQPAWAKGMAGTQGTSWLGAAGLVFTPELDLSCYNGTGIKVEATLVTTVSSFDYNGTNEPEGVYAMILENSSSTTPIASGYLETPKVGSTTGTITISNVPADADLSNVIIAFMNKSGVAFFVDHAKISMDVPAGKSLSAPLRSVATEKNSYTFDGLNPNMDHAFSVVASTTRNYETFVSEASDLQIVKTSYAGIDEIEPGSDVKITTAPGEILVSVPDKSPVEVYSVSGILVGRGTGECAISVSPGIYIVRTVGNAVKVAVR